MGAGEKRGAPEAELGRAASGPGRITEPEVDLAEVRTKTWTSAAVEGALFELGWGREAECAQTSSCEDFPGVER